VGIDFDDFRSLFSDDERAFGFIRIPVRIANGKKAAVSFISDRLLFLLDHVRSIWAEYETIQSGDEMSKRTKFLFVTWLGPNVGTMKRARLSSDKALVKEIIMVNRRTT
jgi:Cofilin/tropomyosin-type actin-binding protein